MIMQKSKRITLKKVFIILGIYICILLYLGNVVNAYFLNKKDPLLRAAHDYKGILENDPNNAEVHAKLGELYLEIEEEKKDKSYLGLAQYEFQKAVEINPNNIDFHYDLAITFDLMKDKKQALTEYKKILSIDPFHPQSNVELARYYAANKQYKKSIFYYKKCLEKETTAANIYFELGKIYELENKQTEAMQMYQTAQKYDPGLNGLKEKLKNNPK
jgi:superkiller protein 3